MTNFQTSTHQAKWIFKPEELVGKYKAANQRAIQTLEKLTSILVQNPLALKKSSLCVYFMKINFKKCAKTFTSLIKFRQQLLYISKVLSTMSLEFDLIVYAPYRSIEGFIDDMGEFCGINDDRLQILQKLLHAAKMEVDKIMLTDALLLFPPGQLALAALRSANQIHLRSILSRQSSEHTVSELVEFLNAIDSWARKYKFPSDKDLKHINRKLKSCWGLSSHDESKKRDKKSKHKSKRSSNEVQPVPSHTEM